MSTNPYTYVESPVVHGGQVWNRLHTERDNVCSALLGNRPVENSSIKGKARLEQRLHQLDDALDRLSSGTFGDCAKCGRWIDDLRLTADPASAYCSECETQSIATVMPKNHTAVGATRNWDAYKKRSSKWRP